MIKLPKRKYYLAQEVCNILGVSKKTLFNWEAQGLISRIPKDWRGWRMYQLKHLNQAKAIIDHKRKKVR